MTSWRDILYRWSTRAIPFVCGGRATRRLCDDIPVRPAFRAMGRSMHH